MAGIKISEVAAASALGRDDSILVVQDGVTKRGTVGDVLDVLPNASRTWFVSNSGNDGNDGLSPATAFLTLDKAASVAVSGDSVRLARGSVFRETANFSAGVTVETFGAGLRPIITGQDIVTEFAIYGSGPAYTFTIDLSAVAANRGYPGVWEDGIRLAEVASIAACEATPGSFFFAGPGSHAGGWAAGIKTYYVHPSDSSDPGSNNKLYEVYARIRAANSTGAKYNGIRFQSGWHHDGVAVPMTDCSIERIARHGNLPSIPQFRDVTVIDTNPAYTGGGLFHSNPGSLMPDCIYDGCIAVSSGYNGIAFYSHGPVAGVPIRERVTLKDCSAYNVATCIVFDDVKSVDVSGFRARNFGAFSKQNLPESVVTVRSANLKGGVGGAGNNARFIAGGVNADALLIIKDSYVEYSSQHLLYSSGGLQRFEMYDSQFVLRTSRIAGSAPSFARAVNTPLPKLWMHRCRVILPNGYDRFIEATAAPDIQIRDCLFVGGVTDSMIGGVATPLSALDPENRVVMISREKAIASDTPEDGITLHQCVYNPGDWIFSAIAHPGGSRQPRTYVAVGDRIITSLQAMDKWNEIATPSSHLNAVCYNSGGDGTAYIAVGDNGLIMRSDTAGKVWSEVGVGITTEHLRGVWAMAGAGLVVAVGDNGTVLRSTDGGTTWALAASSGTTRTMRSVASNRAGTIWVAAGSDGYIIRSTDGDTWTETSLGSDEWYAIYRTGADAQFVVGGDKGAVRTSDDGVTWTPRTTGTKNRVVGFAWGEGQTVAVCRQTTYFTDTFLESSDNGNTWTISETTVPFEVRGVVGPLNPMYSGASDSPYLNMAFMAVGESQSVARRLRKTWNAQRILDTNVLDRSETLEKHLQRVR